MEPKKARMAIAITVITALLIITVCLFMLFDFNPFSAFSSPEPEEETTTESTEAPQAPAQPSSAVPGPADLKGCSNDLYYPSPENYLPEYVAMITNSEEADTVSLQYRPEKKEFSRHVIVEIPNNTPLIALAQENGYTLVLVTEGLGGWIVTQELDPYN